VATQKKKKKVARNFLKFCMEVYNLIVRTSGKDLEKIPTNEVFMRWCLGVGKPRAHFGLGVGKPRACFGLGVGKLVPWCGQAARVGALAWAHWCLGVASRGHVLPLAWASHVHILALAVQRWPRKKKKKSCSEFSQILHGGL
jgi:hypothetical protein